jgi:hypothetical protein
MALWEPPLFTRLEGSQRVLVAGAGGGFDIYAGLPLALALHARGKQVFLANLTFTYLGGTDATALAPHLYEVLATTTGEARYFPERSLARWLASRDLPETVYAFEKVGVQPLRRAYAWLVRELGLDAIVLVDGGTDLLMRGDEAGLGTPEEDMTSLAAVAGLADGTVPTRLAACIGFGIDTFHGVCHAHFLENVAALAREGGYLGAFSVPADGAEGAAFLDAVARAQAETPGRPSIVNGQIAAAVRGDFGDVQFTSRTTGSELFVNPLMSLYFGFELAAVARRALHLADLENTETIFDVAARIEAFRRRVVARPRRIIPH